MIRFARSLLKHFQQQCYWQHVVQVATQGAEYAPNMYHSVAYEPYTQIVDPGGRSWLTSIEYPKANIRMAMLNFITQTTSIHIA